MNTVNAIYRTTTPIGRQACFDGPVTHDENRLIMLILLATDNEKRPFLNLLRQIEDAMERELNE